MTYDLLNYAQGFNDVLKIPTSIWVLKRAVCNNKLNLSFFLLEYSKLPVRIKSSYIF